MRCIRCDEEFDRLTDDLCGHCFWALRAEVESGFYELRQYLCAWARFADWCEAPQPKGGLR